MDYVASNVAHYKKVRVLQFVDTIPKSPSGKIMRRLLKEKMIENMGENSSTANATLPKQAKLPVLLFFSSSFSLNFTTPGSQIIILLKEMFELS